MRRSFTGLVAAMENDKPKTDGDDKEIGDNANSLETDAIEISDSAAEGEAHQAATDEAESTAEALENFAVAIRGAQANGGLNEHGAQILSIATEHMFTRMGIDSHQSSMPALESYGTTSSRLQAGVIALEAINEQIKNIWKAIVAAIKKAYEWVKKYWLQVFGAAEKLQKRAKALEEASRSPGGTMKEKTFENDRLAKALAIENAVPANLVAEATSLKEAVSTVVTVGAKLSGDIGEIAVKALDELKGDSLGPLLAMAKPFPGSEKVGDPQAEGLAAGQEGIEVSRSKQLPGGRALISRTPAASTSGKTLEQMIKLVGETSYTMGKYSSKIKDEPVGKKFNTALKADAGKIANTVGLIAEEMLAYRKATPKLEEMQSKLASAAEKIASGAGAEEDEAKRKDLSACKSIATMANRVFTQPGAEFMKYAVNTSKALLDYVEESLKQYEKAAA